jgi:hypothetical protein
MGVIERHLREITAAFFKAEENWSLQHHSTIAYLPPNIRARHKFNIIAINNL